MKKKNGDNNDLTKLINSQNTIKKYVHTTKTNKDSSKSTNDFIN